MSNLIRRHPQKQQDVSPVWSAYKHHMRSDDRALTRSLTTTSKLFFFYSSYLFSTISSVRCSSSLLLFSLLLIISKMVTARLRSLRSFSIFSYDASSFFRFWKWNRDDPVKCFHLCWNFFWDSLVTQYYRDSKLLFYLLKASLKGGRWLRENIIKAIKIIIIIIIWT